MAFDGAKFAYRQQQKKTSVKRNMIIEKNQMEVLEEFSIWLLANNWEFNYTTRIWENYDNPFQYSFTDVYQLFLKSKEA